MATIVRELWLAAERALFSCNDRHYETFSGLDGSFELWLKATSAWAKTTKKIGLQCVHVWLTSLFLTYNWNPVAFPVYRFGYNKIHVHTIRWFLLNFRCWILKKMLKWVPTYCWVSLTNCWGVTCDGLASCPARGVEILLAASCYRNGDKLGQLWVSGFQGFTF